MRFLFLSFIFLFTLNIALAQTQADWIQHNGAYTTDRGTSVAVDANANVIATGIFTDTLFIDNQTFYGEGFLDGYVAKMDSSGVHLWLQLVLGPKDDIAERVTVFPDGDVLVTGTFADSVRIGDFVTHAIGNDDVWLARLNGADGATEWLISAGSYYAYERVGGLSFSDQAIFWAINFGADLIVGSDTFTAQGFNDALVATVDFNGNILSVQQLTGSGNDNITDIACSHFGEVYVGGRFNETFYGDTATAGFDLFYAKLYNGNVDWLKTAGGWGSEAITALTLDHSNLFIAGLFVDTLLLADSLLLPDDVWSDQVFVTSIDADGNANWFFVGFPDSGADYISDITVACNGDLLFTGFTTYFANESPEAPLQNDDEKKERCQFGDTYIARMSHQGDLLWIKNTLGTNLNSGLGIASDSSGHIYVTGYFTDSLYLANTAVKGNGGNDNFLFRINDSTAACVFEDTTNAVNVPMLSKRLLYPNPSTGNSFLVMNSTENTALVSLSDATGKNIEQATVANDGNPIALFQLFGLRTPGVYTVTLESNGSRETLKWVVTP